MALIVCEHVMNARRRTRGAKATALCSNARSSRLPDTVLKIQQQNADLVSLLKQAWGSRVEFIRTDRASRRPHRSALGPRSLRRSRL